MALFHLKRKRVAFVALALIVLGLGGVITASMWQGPNDLIDTVIPTDQRHQHLVALAAEEAALITEIDRRLTRQLNLADQQLLRGWPTHARDTLAATCQTLRREDADTLNDHARLSGWISISQLARQASDTTLANEACDEAVAGLIAIESPVERCDYVMGVANQVHHLKDPGEAADLLAEAGPWAREIDDLQQKRHALLAFAATLFNLNEYEKGQQMLRNDTDPAWRSDQLLALAQSPTSAHRQVAGQRFMNRAAEDSAEQRSMLPDSPAAPGRSIPTHYGKAMDFQQVFRGQTIPQTQNASTEPR